MLPWTCKRTEFPFVALLWFIVIIFVKSDDFLLIRRRSPTWASIEMSLLFFSINPCQFFHWSKRRGFFSLNDNKTLISSSLNLMPIVSLLFLIKSFWERISWSSFDWISSLFFSDFFFFSSLNWFSVAVFA